MKQLNNQLSAKSKRLLLLSFLLALLPSAVSAQCPDENHPHMIDLGLPSGTKWACCNVGASKPEDYGGYYAWGETEEKEVYERDTYLYYNGEYEFIGFEISGTEYDVAHVKWGESWRMPTKDELQELTGCAHKWTQENGKWGLKITGTNGNSIFVPAAGWRWTYNFDAPESGAYFWSGTLVQSNGCAYYLYGNSSEIGIYDGNERCQGRSVRPVSAGSSTSSGIAIDATNFPDENFRKWVLAQDYGWDGVLTEEEIAGVTVIDVSSQNIADLKGIEYFTALTTLDCHYNQLTSLDVSKNTALEDLSCHYNQLTSLDVSNNKAFRVLNCYNNQLTSLDVLKNTALWWFDCGGNQLTSLDVSENLALVYLSCWGNQLTSLDVSQNTALTSLNCSENQLTSLDVSNNTALKKLSCFSNQLTALDVSNNTALTSLWYGSNPLTSLDVSKNTALTGLQCDNNQLTALDVTNNTALTELYCSNNQLTALDVMNNTALTELFCFNNLLTTLDVSQNTALTYLVCSDNQLTALDVSNNTALTQLWCGYNQINATEMGNLVESLPTNNGELYVKYLNDANEQNVITTAQVAAAKAKGWKVYAWDSNAGDWGEWVEYDGDEPLDISPVNEGETIDMGTEIDSNTNLDGNVVGDVYYSISSGDGSYDPAEGCIVVTKPTDDAAIDGKDIFGEDFKDGFTGIVFKVQAGSGTVKVQAETQGTMTLKVKIGNGAPVEMELEGGKLKVSFPYNVTEDSYVYIYGGSKAAGAKGMNRAPSDGDMLKIYGIEVVSDADGISSIEDGELKMDNSPVYNLNGQRVSEPGKGIYIRNGRKVLIK